MLSGFRRTPASQLRHLGYGVALLSATTRRQPDFCGLCVVLDLCFRYRNGFGDLLAPAK